jgi:hypothetical protein
MNSSKSRSTTVATPDTTTPDVVAPVPTDKRRIPLVVLLTAVVTLAIVYILRPDWFSKAPVDNSVDGGNANQDQNPNPAPPDPVFIIVAVVIPVSVMMSIIGYQAFVSGALKESIRRVSPYLGIIALCVVAGGVIRPYPSSWSTQVSNLLICVGYLLGLYLVVKEFDLLPWDRKKKDEEEKRKRERKARIRASLIEWARAQKTELEKESDLVKKRDLVKKLAEKLDSQIRLFEQRDKEEEEERVLKKLRGAVAAWESNDPVAGDKMWEEANKSLSENK